MPDQRSSADTPGLRHVNHSLDQVEAGADLRTRVTEHYAHLLQLSEKLKRLGMDEAAIDDHVMGIFERYSAQLMHSFGAVFPPGESGGAQPMLNVVQGDEERVCALEAFEVLDTEPEEAFDRITRLAKTVLKVPTVLVSLIDRNRQWFKSRQGMEARETPRHISFCSRAIEQDAPLIVPDAQLDPRFAANPLVTGDFGLRFYAGAQLTDRNGFKLGTLCCMDKKPREMSADEVAILQDLARLVMDELELRLLATTDGLTGCMTRRAFLEAGRRDIAQARRQQSALTCVMLDADHFKAVNDTYGHAMGDEVLRRVAATCRGEMRTSDYVGRLGGEEFAMVLRDTSEAAGIEVAERLRLRIGGETYATPQGAFAITVSSGVASLERGVATIEALLHRADAALYSAKAGGRNRTVAHGQGGNALRLAV